MRTPIDVVGRAAAVVRAIANEEPAGATTSTIARNTGLARPTAHRLLSSLLSEGFVDRDPSGRWMLGPELYLLGTAAAPRYDITSLAQPIVRRLATTTGESAFFSARRGNETVCLIREDGSFPIRSHVLHEGIRFPLGVASAGMAMLAYLPDTEIDAYLRSADLAVLHGEQHAESEVRAAVKQTRDAGYALNPGMIVEGSWGMGAAVFDTDGTPQWALSLTGIEQRFSADRRPEMGRTLLQAAHELTKLVRSGRVHSTAAS